MKKPKLAGFLETLTTTHLITFILLIVLLPIGAYAAVLGLKLTNVNSLASFVDSVFKTEAILVGAVWTLNRYFVSRTDEVQLKVEADVNLISASKFGNPQGKSLLLYRIDVLNTGKVLIPEAQKLIIICSVAPTIDDVIQKQLHRWPSKGYHSSGRIEPGSWSATNSAVSIPSEVKAVYVYLEYLLPNGNKWTWHKTFDVSKTSIESTVLDAAQQIVGPERG